jgi:flagellar biosynthesis protein FlhA
VGEGEVHPNQWLAINPGRVSMQLQGVQATDPAFGLPAVWVDTAMKEQAQAAGYTVVDASTVVATHLSHILQTSASSLLGRNETQLLLDHFTKTAPKIIEDLTPKLLPITVVQRVLQNLLDEGVHIRDLRTIFETLLEMGSKSQVALELTASVRMALGRAIVQGLVNGAGDLHVLVLEPRLEQMVTQSQATVSPDVIGIEPMLAESISQQANEAATRQEALGQSPVLLVPDSIRVPLVRLLRRAVPRLKVLSHSEIPESRTVRVASVIGAKQS